MSESTELVESARRIVADLLRAEVESRVSALERLQRGGGHWYAIDNIGLDLGLRINAGAKGFVFGIAVGRGGQDEVAEMRLRLHLSPAREAVERRGVAPELRVRELSFVTQRRGKLVFAGGPTVTLATLETKRWNHDQLLRIFAHLNHWSEGEDDEVRMRALSESNDDHYRLVSSIATGIQDLVAEFAGPTAKLGVIGEGLTPLTALLGTHYRLDGCEALVAMRVNGEGKLATKANELSQTLELRAVLHHMERGEQLWIDVDFAGVVRGERKQAIRRALADASKLLADAVNDVFTRVEISAEDFSSFLEQASETGLFVGHLGLGDPDSGGPNHVVVLTGRHAGSPAYLFFDVVLSEGPEGEFLLSDPGMIAVRWKKKLKNRTIGPGNKRDRALHDYVALLLRSLAAWV